MVVILDLYFTLGSKSVLNAIIYQQFIFYTVL